MSKVFEEHETKLQEAYKVIRHIIRAYERPAHVSGERLGSAMCTAHAFMFVNDPVYHEEVEAQMQLKAEDRPFCHEEHTAEIKAEIERMIKSHPDMEV